MNHPEYIVTLKGLAKEVGIDAPLYTMTGWGAALVPENEILPLRKDAPIYIDPEKQPAYGSFDEILQVRSIQVEPLYEVAAHLVS